LGLGEILPDKTKGENRKVGPTYLATDKHQDKTDKWSWEGKRKPSEEEKRKMLGKLIGKMVQTVMENHLYQFGGKLYRQISGGPIGLLLTGTVARIVMLVWDRKFGKKLEELGLEAEEYHRYVDDQGIGTWATPPGLVFNEGRLQYKEDEGREEEPADERTAKLYRQVANSVMPMIQLEEDFASKNGNGRIPVLDLEVWVHNNRVHHTFYRKPMASTDLVSNNSALSKQVRKSVIMEEGMRRLRNVSMREGKEEKERHMSEFLLDMREAGYKESYRNGMLDTVVGRKAKEEDEHLRWERKEEGGKPAYRTREERRKEKEEKGEGMEGKESWYKKAGHTSVLWVPATREGKLEKKIREVLEKTNPPKGTKIKVVQKGGKTTSSNLILSNPFPRGNCGRKNCAICKQEGGGEEGSQGMCFRGNIGYVGFCNRCPIEDIESGTEVGQEVNAVYHGESSRTLYRRSLDHFEGYVKRKDRNWMWEHCRDKHRGRINGDGMGDFNFKVMGSFRDATTRIADEAMRVLREEEGRETTFKSDGKVEVLNTKEEFYSTKDVRVRIVQF
jgi:hypothetical protein